MATIQRLRVIWTGSAVVGGGVSTFYFDTPSAGFPADVASLFEGIKTLLPASVTVTIPSTGDELESTTGDITGTWSDGSPATKTGTAPDGSYAAGVGGRLIWNTLGRTNNRRVRGTTFIVPLASDSYTTDGTLGATPFAQLRDNAAALVAAQTGSLVIWTRPKPGTAGTLNSVVEGTAADNSSWLRTRKT